MDCCSMIEPEYLFARTHHKDLRKNITHAIEIANFELRKIKTL